MDYKKVIIVPLGTLVLSFVGNTVAEILAEKYECRKWYNFLRPSVHCHVIKQVSSITEFNFFKLFTDYRFY